jgi:hypothetical protein
MKPKAGWWSSAATDGGQQKLEAQHKSATTVAHGSMRTSSRPHISRGRREERQLTISNYPSPAIGR